jgi:Flp pilus assembly protein TadG
MWITSLLNNVRNSLQRFGRAERGNVMITFALATIPMIGFVGAAVDYSRGNAAKASMQAAVDATALMLSKDVASLSSSAMNTKATSIFSALLNRPDVANVIVTPTYSTDTGTQLVVTATGKVATTFMKVMGQTQLNIDVSSTVRWGNSKLRVALALDTTGSMAQDGKITALKTATKNLLSQLQGAAAQNGDVLVSIIPFAKSVNVGKTNYATATWIDWSVWDALKGGSSGTSLSGSICYNGTLWVVSGMSFTNGGTCTAPTSGICYNGTLWNWNGTSFTNNGTCNASSMRASWTGCVTDRGNTTGPNTGNYDTNVVAPTTGILATLFTAADDSNCPQEIMPLGYNWSAMTTRVDSLNPGGMTNQGIGLAHGWMSLVGGGPYPTPPAMDPNYTYSKVIILLTDGLNTQNRWYSDQASIDARQQMTCTNIKAAGITIYTIQVNTGGDPVSTLLQNCASSPDKFFHLTSANAIITTFQQIGTNLSHLRVAR